MSTSIRLSKELAMVSRAESKLMHRSQSGQLEHWVQIGRAIEHSGAFNYNQVALALKGQLPVDELTVYEKPVFDAMHDEAMKQHSDQEKLDQQHRLAAYEAAGVDIKALGD